jgi:TPP-dependent pyruvate/acetoin dehydrogenase alpha subunit
MTTKIKKSSAASAAPPGGDGFSLISDGKLLELYAAMVKARIFDERIGAFFRQGKLRKGYEPALGREASAAGVAIGLLPDDTLALSRRSLIPCLVKGVPLVEIFAHLFSRRRGRSSPGGAGLRAAIAAAEAHKRDKSARISVLYCAAEELARPGWREAMRSAGAESLPIVFVCHDRPGSGRGALRAPVFGMTALQARKLGFPAIAVDGNDAVAVYRVASEAAAHARRGNGPTLIECQPWRPAGQERNGQREAEDCILKMEKYLDGKGLFIPEMRAEAAAEFERQMELAVEAARRRFPED